MKNTNILLKKLSITTGFIIKPIIVYTDLTLGIKTMFKDNKGKSGVYRLINLKTTRMKILVSTKTSQIVLITDTFNNVTTKYLSAKRAAEAIGVSNFTIMNKLKGKNTKLYKSRYLIKGLNKIV